jgi:hypothetical protein
LTSSIYLGPLPNALANLVSAGAAYYAEERRPPPRCHPGTRKEVLESIDEWIESGTPKVCWLHGPAGSGKSAVAQTVSEKYAGLGQLAASFFFTRSGGINRNAMKHLFPTLIVQIAISSPEKREYLAEAFHQDPLIVNREGGPINLLVGMFLSDGSGRSGSSSHPSTPHLVVIDGLDECNGSEDQRLILKYIHELVDKHHSPLRFLIVSRPEPQIQRMFAESGILQNISEVLSLYGLRNAKQDVLTFLKNEFARIHDSERHMDIMAFVPKPWPSNEVLEELSKRSGGYFIYASTLIRHIDEEGFSCLERLDQVLNMKGSGGAVFGELDRLYRHVLSSSRNLGLLKKILGFSIFMRAFDYPDNRIAAFLHLRPGEIMLTLRGLHSIIQFDHYPGFFFIVPIHASFHDFIVDESRSQAYHIDEETWYEDVFEEYLHSVSTFHERNDHPSILWVLTPT